jgi:hypothetical protein
MASPSRSEAESVMSVVAFSRAIIGSAIGARLGGRSVLAMLIAVDADPESTFDAVKVTESLPA